jgi:hypothetical protein
VLIGELRLQFLVNIYGILPGSFWSSTFVKGQKKLNIEQKPIYHDCRFVCVHFGMQWFLHLNRHRHPNWWILSKYYLPTWLISFNIQENIRRWGICIPCHSSPMKLHRGSCEDYVMNEWSGHQWQHIVFSPTHSLNNLHFQTLKTLKDHILIDLSVLHFRFDILNLLRSLKSSIQSCHRCSLYKTTKLPKLDSVAWGEDQ